MEQSKLRLVIQLLTIVAKTGQWRNLFQLIYWAVMGKKSWDEAMERANGEFYKKQIKIATEEFIEKNKKLFSCDTSGVPGFDKWVNTTKD